MHIRFDRSDSSVLALCTCGWRDIATTQAAADLAAMDHLDRAHPVPTELLALEAQRIRNTRNRLKTRRRS